VGELLGGLRWIDSVAAFVWIGLTVLILIALKKVYQSEGRFGKDCWLIVVYLVLIYSYPLYTGFFSSLTLGLIGNIVVFLFLAYLVWRLWGQNRAAALLLSPALVWLTIASVYVTLQLLHRGS
jgi:tryptophan-rich sensory protein